MAAVIHRRAGRGFRRGFEEKVGRALRALMAWRAGRSGLRQLASLSDATLLDLGLDRASIEREAQRPFWAVPDFQILERQRRRNRHQGGSPWPTIR